MKNSFTLLFILLGSFAYSQNKVYDYAYVNKKGICVYSIAEKKEYLISKEGNDPRISPDGKKVAYTSFNKKGERVIAVIDINTKAIIILNTNSANCYRPVWSPDGKFIVYNVSDDSKRDKWSIAIINTNNTVPKILNVRDCYSPVWFNNSTNIVVQNMSDVFIVELSGKIKATYHISDFEQGIPELNTKNVGASSSDNFIFTKNNKKILFNAEVDEDGSREIAFNFFYPLFAQRREGRPAKRSRGE